ncbi:hypothetical protein IT084_02580 [Desulfallas sp. Bu1-1]|uniref:hypothetical protein n=1 Tax=Desulfallas sp. Bu1-1 TaxID=2787620 RepID=UPI00189FF3D5|nr:hypothetical protein [Desulfallas sp. Bu1-1]MBF7081860.1 hypothetical protein [Desulfallas sp. Bu1-1]
MDKLEITVARGFQTSVNIAYDLYNDDKVRSFIPTMSSLDVIEDVLLSTKPGSTQRARILIGAYGRGKSHIVLVLISLLFKKDATLFTALLEKMKAHNPELCDYAEEYIKSDKALLPIIVSGSSASLTQSFLTALEQSLKANNLENLMPETNFKASINTIENWKENYPQTYKQFVKKLGEPVDDFILSLKEYDVRSYEKFEKLYPDLTSGSTFNPFLGFDVVELYEAVVNRLKEHGYDGVYIIYDEFSKYLEASIANATISDVKLLQDFAEKCDRSGSKQMHLMLISHKDIANYIDDKLPKDKVDGWRGVSGRFKHINLHNNFSQMYEIISAVIKKEPDYWTRFCKKNREKFDDMKLRFVKSDLIDAVDADTAVMGCYPLHPVSTFILPRLSERVAQNERTLFTFLSAEQKHTLLAFLQSAEDDFPLLTPDYLYDYFEPLLRKEAWTTDIHKQYKLTETVLRRVEQNSLEAKIIKTISLIYIIEQFEKLPPICDVIIDTFRDSMDNIERISRALSNLIEKDCIVYLKRSNNYLKLKESSGVDIKSEIKKMIEKTEHTMSVTKILNEFAFDSFMYPTGYNDEHEITRYFNFTFISSSDFFNVEDWNDKLKRDGSDGTVFAIVPRNKSEIESIVASIADGNCNHNRAVFAVPTDYVDIEKMAYEYHAVLQLKTQVVDDELLSDEYDIYIEDLEEVIGSFIDSYMRPELGGVEYYYMGKKQAISRKAQISMLLSYICESNYPHTPIINNESINKNILPTTAINSRTKLVASLLENDLEANLGLSGTGQDVSFMRSTLIQTGVLCDADTVPYINLEPEDANLRYVLAIIQEFFVGPERVGEQCFSELYDTLTLPEHGIGMKKGVIPIYIAAVLHQHKKSLVIKNRDREVKITADILNSINEKPEDFSVIRVDWDAEKTRYMSELEDIFRDYVVEKEKIYNSFSYIVLAMNRWFVALPKYAKEMTEVYYVKADKPMVKAISKEQRKFINSLKFADNNAREYLFEKIPSFFGLREFSPTIANSIRKTKKIYDSAISELIKVLAVDVKTMFGGGSKPNASLTSVIKDWVEQLDEATMRYLFPNNENSILELMNTITNDESVFIKRLGKAVTSLRIEDWNAGTIKSFLSELKNFKETIENFNTQSQNDSTPKSDYYKFAFVSKDGREIVRTFAKTEYSPKAKLLLNEITSNMEEYGQALSKREKRQVLIELLERLC